MPESIPQLNASIIASIAHKITPKIEILIGSSPKEKIEEIMVIFATNKMI